MSTIITEHATLEQLRTLYAGRKVRLARDTKSLCNAYEQIEAWRKDETYFGALVGEHDTELSILAAMIKEKEQA